MSTAAARPKASRLGIPEIRARKGATPLVCLTAYTAPVAALLDRHADLLLVGDSLGMVVYGMDTTLAVTVEMMIAHGAAVVRATGRAPVVVDLPFGSFEAGPAQAFGTAARILAQTGCDAVKLEGGREHAETIRFLTDRGVPVMGHVGLMPQRAKALGGFKAQGRDAEEAEAILADAREVAQAGAFAMVVEGVWEAVARRVTEAVDVPTIGIGASPACDGQILVTDDLLGLFQGFTPRFVRRYADVAGEIDRAAHAYAEDVRARRFPGPEHLFGAASPKAAE